MLGIYARKRKGYTLIAILSILGFVYFIYERIVNTTLLHALYSKTFLAKEQARQLLFAGISLALLKLTSFENGVIVEEENEVLAGISTKTVITNNNGVTPRDRLKSFYFGLLPILNSWQKISLTDEFDGITADIYFCLTSEDGKLPLNDIYDFENKSLKPDYKEFFEKCKVSNLTAGEGNVAVFLEESFAGCDQRNFDDVTFIPAQEKLEFFYKPKNLELAVKCEILDQSDESLGAAKNNSKNNKDKLAAKEEQAKKNAKSKKQSSTDFYLYLADLFRVMNINNNKINPLLLTSSMEACLGISEESIDRQSNSFTKALYKIVDVIDFSVVPDKNLIFSLLGVQSQDLSDNQKASAPSDNLANNKSQNEIDLKSEQSQNDKFSLLSKFFSKNMDPEFFSLLCLVRYNEISEQAVIIFRRQPIKEKYAVSSDQSGTAGTLSINNAKNSNVDSRENAQDGKKDANLYRRCFFLPDGFEIIRFYWL